MTLANRSSDNLIQQCSRKFNSHNFMVNTQRVFCQWGDAALTLHIQAQPRCGLGVGDQWATVL